MRNQVTNIWWRGSRCGQRLLLSSSGTRLSQRSVPASRHLTSQKIHSSRADLHVSVIFSKNTSFGSHQKYGLGCFIWWSLFAIGTNDTLGYTWLWELGNSISSPDTTNYYEMFILRILKPTTLFMTEFRIPYSRFWVFLSLVSSIIIRLRISIESNLTHSMELHVMFYTSLLSPVSIVLPIQVFLLSFSNWGKFMEHCISMTWWLLSQ